MEEGKCLTCQHWGGNYSFGGISSRGSDDIEQFRYKTGTCDCSGVNNPYYQSGERLTADNGCGFWEKNMSLKRLEREAEEAPARAAAKEAAERKAREEKEAAERKAREEKEASEKLHRVAEQGDADAQFNLGYSYFTGQGVTQDYTKAVEWFGKAAAQGHVGAKDWLTKAEVAIVEEKTRKTREAAERVASEKREKAKKAVAKIGLVLQLGVTAAVFSLMFTGFFTEDNGAYDHFFGSLPFLLQLALPVGVPAIVIGIISLVFRKGSGSFVGIGLIAFIDIVLSIYFAVILAKGFWSFIGNLILCLIVFSISAIPGFIMAGKEEK